MTRPYTFYEFFAGGGMARTGLGDGWRCLFANDFDATKGQVYRANFADAAAHFSSADIWTLGAADLAGQADLAWASSPCQDFSLAGARAGLSGGRSSALTGFWRLMEALAAEGRAPRTLVVENVVGLLTSHEGADFTALCEALASQGYRFGALEIDAEPFVPQSRPRVFVVATRASLAGLEGPSDFHTQAVRAAHERLPTVLKSSWVWWRLGAPPRRNTTLENLLEPDDVVTWRSDAETQRLLALMEPRHRDRVEALAQAPERRVGAVFRRTRKGIQRAEARFDGLAGCLRTPRGGSSRQMLLVIEGGRIRSRLLSGREGARLMGLPEDYLLPNTTTAALHVVGDGVAVPVVSHLARELLELLLEPSRSAAAAA